ncbi:MAG: hypothetical protein ACLFUJ_08355 [Phycisphaerae bacterium]
MFLTFQAILVALLVTAILGALLIGLTQSLRSRAMARLAHRQGLRFSSDDPFNVPMRYTEFGLIRSGHSPRAYNVVHGRKHLPIRLFEFRYEAGHGTHRLTRLYSCIVLDLPAEAPEVLLWHGSDPEGAPLEARQIDGTVGPWTYRGSDEDARKLAEICSELGPLNISIETRGATMLCCSADHRQPIAAEQLVDCVLRTGKALSEKLLG